MVANLKALSCAKTGKYYHSIDQMWIEEKDKDLKTHPSQISTQKTDEFSKQDSFYQKCQQSHPSYYFNNQGLLHIKLKKFSLASYYLSKALKFTERCNDKLIMHP